MFKVKHLPLSLPFYDRLGIERWLHKQAAAGWYLESAGHVFWRFRKGDPKVLHYAVVYQPALDPDDPASEPRALQFAQYCAHAGWLLVSDSARMQIYSNDSTAPLPIETDPLLELDRIHATAKKSYLRHAYLCVLASALHLLSFLLRFGSVSSFIFAGNGAVVYALASILLLALAISNVAGYYRWYRKAKLASQMGTRAPNVKRGTQCVLLTALVICFGAYLVTVGWQAAVVILGAMMLIAFGVKWITGNSKRMRQQGYPVFENRVYSGLLSALLIFAVTFTALLMGELVEGRPPKETAPPIHIQELNGQIAECECKANVMESIFIRRTRVDCANEELGYQVVDVKLPFVYDAVVDFYLDMWQDPIYARLMGEGFDPNFRAVSAQPWGAVQAYALIWEPKDLYAYVICYSDRVIYVGNSEPLTEEQIGLIGEKLNG